MTISDEPERAAMRGGTNDDNGRLNDLPGARAASEEPLAPEALQPETQGDAPSDVELGDEGQGDIAPEDL